LGKRLILKKLKLFVDKKTSEDNQGIGRINQKRKEKREV
jgi:hypothetical protein